MSGTVYVVQDHRRYDKDTGEYVSVHDLSPAEEFGQLKYLLSPTAAPWATESIINDLWGGAGRLPPGDYLLMVGNPVLWRPRCRGRLRHHRGPHQLPPVNGRERRYTPVEAQVFDVDRAPPGITYSGRKGAPP
jgi:hypothetical protein